MSEILWDILDILRAALQAALVVLVPMLSASLIKFIKAKAADGKAATDNEYIQSIIERVTTVVSNAVAYVSQTYVDGLKKSDKFTKENQEEAFGMAYNMVMGIIGDETRELLAGVFSDFNGWVSSLIEAAVRWQKPALPLPEIVTPEEPAPAEQP